MQDKNYAYNQVNKMATMGALLFSGVNGAKQQIIKDNEQLLLSIGFEPPGLEDFCSTAFELTGAGFPCDGFSKKSKKADELFIKEYFPLSSFICSAISAYKKTKWGVQ